MIGIYNYKKIDGSIIYGYGAQGDRHFNKQSASNVYLCTFIIWNFRAYYFLYFYL